MEFSPANNIVKLCLQGMAMEDNDKPEEAGKLFSQAWNEATNDFERFLAAYYIARRSDNAADKLQWYQRALQHALQADDAAPKTALASLYSNIAQCYEDMGDPGNAKQHLELAESFRKAPADKGPFYHGTRADLRVGDLLTPGRISNYKSEVVMNHIYFTALVNGAGLAAALAKGDGPERVYMVEPAGAFENDPNVTDKKFPGNPTRSYRTDAPLKVIDEITGWVKMAPAELERFKEKLANSSGEIIN